MQQKEYLKSLTSALNILNSFTFDASEQSVSEIARKLLMNKSKVSRILSTLAAGNLLVKSTSNQKYRLGSKVLELASIYFSKRDLRTIALPYLEELKRETNETVAIFALEGDHRVCLDRLESPQEIRMSMRVGEHLPLHAGASSKLLLAYLPAERREKLIKNKELYKLTPYTITSRETLEKELIKIRKQGFAVSFQERVSLAAAVAVPIVDYAGGVVAGVSIGGPAMRFTPQKVKKYAALAKETADRISRELGYRGRGGSLGKKGLLADENSL